MKRIIITILAITLCFFFNSCEMKLNVNQREVLFMASGNAGRSISTGEGGNSVSFSELTSQKIKLECLEGTGYCSLSDATEDFVAWPTSSVKLSYGKWVVKAEGYKGSEKYYENSQGVEFIVGPNGVSTDDGVNWGTSILIIESYVNSNSAIMRANSSLTVKDETGSIIEISSGDYENFELRWYISGLSSPATLPTLSTLEELCNEENGFVEWSDPTNDFSIGSTVFVAVVIVDKTNPSTIFGLEAVRLDSTKPGQSYVIGSGSGDYIQFGKKNVTFNTPTEG